MKSAMTSIETANTRYELESLCESIKKIKIRFSEKTCTTIGCLATVCFVIAMTLQIMPIMVASGIAGLTAVALAPASEDASIEK